jgi:hypothetical protein
MYEAIEACNSLFLVGLTEPKENTLRIVVAGTSLGQQQDVVDDLTGDVLVRDARPIVHAREDPVFAIEWKQYVTYAVMNESWGVFDDTGPREGTFIVRFSDSSFLRWVRSRTWEGEEAWFNGEPRRHWQINCENHSIDIVSMVDPEITPVHRSDRS